MRTEATVMHRMADGTLCRTGEELAAYSGRTQLPEEARRLMLAMKERGAALRQGEQKQPGPEERAGAEENVIRIPD